jgi:hypothetical protein
MKNYQFVLIVAVASCGLLALCYFYPNIQSPGSLAEATPFKSRLGMFRAVDVNLDGTKLVASDFSDTISVIGAVQCATPLPNEDNCAWKLRWSPRGNHLVCLSSSGHSGDTRVCVINESCEWYFCDENYGSRYDVRWAANERRFNVLTDTAVEQWVLTEGGARLERKFALPADAARVVLSSSQPTECAYCTPWDEFVIISLVDDKWVERFRIRLKILGYGFYNWCLARIGDHELLFGHELGFNVFTDDGRLIHQERIKHVEASECNGAFYACMARAEGNVGGCYCVVYRLSDQSCVFKERYEGMRGPLSLGSNSLVYAINDDCSGMLYHLDLGTVRK